MCAAGTLASPSAKNPVAPLTGMASTSLMSLPPRVYSSTDAWNRRPSHSSHGDSTVAITPSSVKMTPAPLQVEQAPSELELNNAGFTPLAFPKDLRDGHHSTVDITGHI